MKQMMTVQYELYIVLMIRQQKAETLWTDVK